MSTRIKNRKEEVYTNEVRPFEEALDKAPTIAFYDNEKATVADVISHLTAKIAKLHTVKHYSVQQIVAFCEKNNAPFVISENEVKKIITAYETKNAEIRAKRKLKKETETNTKKESSENVEVKKEQEHVSEPIKEIKEAAKSDL